MSAPRTCCYAFIFACALSHGIVRGDEQRKRPPPTFTVAKETTYFVGPLDHDGYVDYVAAINQHYGRGVTPQNNANVLYWRATGPFSEGGMVPPAFFKPLGIEPPPKEGQYYLDLGRFLNKYVKLNGANPRFAQIYDELSKHAMSKPWHEGMFPELGMWLTFNAEPLATIGEGSKRPASFGPLYHPRGNDFPEPLMNTILYGASARRDFCRALTARAMLHLGEGRPQAAWGDLQTCHRLARHVAHGPWLVEHLIALSIENNAAAADVTFLRNADFTAAQFAAHLEDLQALPAWPSLAEQLGVTERIVFLDSMQMVVRHGRLGLDVLLPMLDENSPPEWVGELDLAGIDWNEALQTGNQWCDRYAQALRIEDRQKLLKQLDQLEGKLRDLDVRAAMKLPDAWASRPPARKAVSQRFGAYMFLASFLQSAAISVRSNQRQRALQSQQNLQIAFALAAHRAATGRYPARLLELSPRYLKEVPQDLFAGGPLLYSAAENAYVLYSVGPNGKDDGARGPGDTPPGDDLAIRMPGAE